MLRGGCPTVPVADFDHAIGFYTDTLGLKLIMRFGDEWACLDAGGGLLIGLVPRSEGGVRGQSVGLCVTEPFDGVVEALRKRGVEFGGPLREGGAKLAFFTDPDGNALYLTDTPPTPTTRYTDQGGDDEHKPFFDHLGLRWDTVDHDRVAVELDIRDDLRGPAGTLQGGVIATLVDVAAASTAALSGTDLVATTEMTLHYLAPGRFGPVKAVGELLRSGARGLAVEVRVYDKGLDDRLMAVGLAAFVSLKES